MTCLGNCKHQICPSKYACAYPLRQAEGGQVIDTLPAEPLDDLADPWVTLCIGLALLLSLFLVVAGIAMFSGIAVVIWSGWWQALLQWAAK